MATLFDSRNDISRHMTRPDDETARMIATHAGMAHWAGSGPNGATCRECLHWDFSNGYRASAGGGEIKPGSCRKFRALMMSVGAKVPHNAAACKYFDASPDPKPVRRPA